MEFLALNRYYIMSTVIVK